MDEGSVNESGSEHSLPPSGSNVSDSKKNNRERKCNVCENYFDEDTMWSRYRSNLRENYTREEYISPSSFWSPSRKIWICHECYTSTPIGRAPSSSRTNQAPSSSRTNQVDKEVVQQKTTSDSCNEISATNPTSQTQPRPAESSPPMKKQKKSDNDAHSDSESEK